MARVVSHEFRKDPLFGQLLDVDSHIYLPVDVYTDMSKDFGENTLLAFYKRFVKSEEYQDGLRENRNDVFGVKGLCALGASDPKGRLEALDLMGNRAALAFAQCGGQEFRMNTDVARAVNKRVSEWHINWCRQTKGRTLPAVSLNMTNRDWAVAELERLLKTGAIGAINVSCASPPGGVSPAHTLWDKFWAMLEEADVPAMIHLGGGGMLSFKEPDPMIPERGWGNSETLKGMPAERGGGEEAVSPYLMLVAHIPAEIYLQTMVMGRVFERFPKLRFGILEFGTTWIGPCVKRMDMWADFQVRVVGRKFEMKPSEYVRRNVRTAPFFHEDLAEQIHQYGLEEIYCYSTDFPHLEGSKDPIVKFRQRLASFSESYQRDFFINNGKWLLPRAA